MLAEGNFDLILMDVHMPEMDGLEATQAIRQQEQTSGSHIPIIAMTASAMKGDREECLAAGMDGFVSKPVDQSELFTAVESVPPCGSKSDPDAVEMQAAAADASSSEVFDVTERSRPIASGDSDRAEPLIDWEAAWRQIPGDRDLAKQLAELLLTEGPKLIRQMQDGLSAGDSVLVQRSAHTFKSSVGIFAAVRLVDSGEQIEVLAKEQQLDKCAHLVPELENLMNCLSEELNEFLIQQES
jgi:CheY-like chemotaxis protein